MAIPKRNTRGLQDIRTLAGRAGGVTSRHEAYLRIACLEMEKVRRGTEKRSSMHRIDSIDARLREIDAEKKALLRRIPTPKQGNPAPSRTAAPEPPPNRSTGSFRLRY